MPSSRAEGIEIAASAMFENEKVPLELQAIAKPREEHELSEGDR
jgi:hypothetical protein